MVPLSSTPHMQISYDGDAKGVTCFAPTMRLPHRNETVLMWKRQHRKLNEYGTPNLSHLLPQSWINLLSCLNELMLQIPHHSFLNQVMLLPFVHN